MFTVEDSLQHSSQSSKSAKVEDHSSQSLAPSKSAKPDDDSCQSLPVTQIDATDEGLGWQVDVKPASPRPLTANQQKHLRRARDLLCEVERVTPYVSADAQESLQPARQDAIAFVKQLEDFQYRRSHVLLYTVKQGKTVVSNLVCMLTNASSTISSVDRLLLGNIGCFN